VRRKASIPRIAGEKRTVAEIFHAIPAEAADAAGVSQPGDSYAVADTVCRYIWANEVDTADDFMAGNYGIANVGQLTVDDVKVGPANTTGIHANADFAIAGNGICAFP
jgi:hypothetical protein